MLKTARVGCHYFNIGEILIEIEYLSDPGATYASMLEDEKTLHEVALINPDYVMVIPKNIYLL